MVYLRSLVLLTVALLPLRSAAQVERPFTGALIAGANFSQVDGDDYYGYHKIGLNTGGAVYAHFTEQWGASMELLYSQKGSRGGAVSEYPGTGPRVDKYYIKLNYVEVPVTLHYLFRTIDLEAGASYSRLINSKEYAISGQYIAFDPEVYRFNASDINYVFGIGRKVYDKFFLNIRFQYSIVPMRPMERIPAGFIWDDKGQFNNLVNIRVMYLL